MARGRCKRRDGGAVDVLPALAVAEYRLEATSGLHAGSHDITVLERMAVAPRTLRLE